MKRWAALTVLLYVLALAALAVPCFLAAFSWIGPPLIGGSEAVDLALRWGTWLWLGVAAISQALLLVVPVGLAERRPVSRRRLVVPLMTSSLLLALMSLSFVATVLCALAGDQGLEIFVLKGILDDQPRLHLLVGYPLVAWSAWGYVFHRRFRHADPDSLTQRLTTWLLRGSLLELLVAVPSHVIARNRGECCAQFATFWGLATGLTLMLMSFGPGVFFLFAARVRRLRREAPP